MTDTILVSGGNIATANVKTVGFAYITRTGSSARLLHRMVKLAKAQGVTVTGSYRYSVWTPSLQALNIDFTGPRDAVDSLAAFINKNR